MGAALIAAAVSERLGRRRARRFLAAAWGMVAGMLYMSFFGKLAAPQTVNADNFDLAFLTGLVGIAWLVALAGVSAAIGLHESDD